MARKKVLLMGKAHSGKTSMRSIIFANYLARDTMRLSPTLDVEHHHVRFLGDLVLNLWDCGGQDAFYESYFERDRETIFRSVELLIYVFDIESEHPEKDFDHFSGVLEAMEENSPDARIFVLVHKMDLVAEEDREFILEDRQRLIADICHNFGVQKFQCFGTSIWDETLYKAWSEIVTNLIPNIGLLESHLDDFCRVCDADEVVLFERATFLVVSHAQAKNRTNEKDNLLEDDNNANSANEVTAHMDSNNNNSNSGNMNVIGNEITPITSRSNSVNELGLDDPDLHTDPPSEYTSESPLHSSTPTLPSALDTNTNTPPSHPPAVERQTPQFDAHRFEKISNIVKQFKLSCGKAQSQFQGMEVRNSHFSAFIDAFTVNTYIMVIVSDPNVHSAATLLNIRNARRHFERFIPRS